MTFDANERDQLRHGLAILVDEAPVAPEFTNLTATKLSRPRRRRAPLVAFAASAAAVVVALGGFAVMKAGNPSGIDAGSGTPGPTAESVLPSSTTTSASPSSSTTLPMVAPGELPHVVLDAAGWEIDYVDESRGEAADGSGEHHDATIQFTDTQTEAELRVMAGVFADLDSLVVDREASGIRLAEADVLGATAVVVRSGGSYHTAMWVIDDVVYEFRAELEEGSFRSLVASLTFVNDEDWIVALPDTVVTDRPDAVRQFLADVPVPAGFDPSSLEAGPEEHWYQVGAEVVGAVTCAWIDQWIAAKTTRDRPAIDQAVSALGTSREWGILIEMKTEGDYPLVVWEYADAIAGDGTVIGGRVLTVEESYRNAFGCPTP